MINFTLPKDFGSNSGLSFKPQDLIDVLTYNCKNNNIEILVNDYLIEYGFIHITLNLSDISYIFYIKPDNKIIEVFYWVDSHVGGKLFQYDYTFFFDMEDFLNTFNNSMVNNYE
jgi:hypothetical protein